MNYEKVISNVSSVHPCCKELLSLLLQRGINDSEQAVLNELKTSVKMNGSEMVIPSEFVNQAENYFNTIDMTADESSRIVAVLKKGESFLENSGASNIADLTFARSRHFFLTVRKLSVCLI